MDNAYRQSHNIAIKTVSPERGTALFLTWKQMYTSTKSWGFCQHFHLPDLWWFCQTFQFQGKTQWGQQINRPKRLFKLDVARIFPKEQRVHLLLLTSIKGKHFLLFCVKPRKAEGECHFFKQTKHCTGAEVYSIYRKAKIRAVLFLFTISYCFESTKGCFWYLKHHDSESRQLPLKSSVLRKAGRLKPCVFA